MSLGQVLLVDDEPTLRRVISRALVKFGFDVVEAADGPAALDKARKTPFDVVVSDVRMPGMWGIDLLALLLEDDPDLPVVLISGSMEVSSRAVAVELGAFDYLQKPLVLAELQQSVLRAVKAHERRRLGRRSEVA